MIAWLSLADNRARLFRWSAILGSFAAVQLLVQALNALSGFMLVRTLEKPDYAWFTIASGMSAALSLLSDSGISIAVMSIGGSIWQDRRSLKGLVTAALRLRAWLAAISSVAVGLMSLWLLLRNGAGLSTAVGLTMLVLAPIWQISTSTTFNVVNRLHSRTRQLQLADLVPALVRTVLTAALVRAGYGTPTTALGAVLIAHLAQFLIVRNQVTPLLHEVEPSNVEEYGAAIRKTVRQVLPNGVFVCVQAQLSTWLLTVFATTSEVADLGALTRLAIIFAVFGGPVGQFVAPAFARATSLRRLWLMPAAVVAGSLLFSSLLLFAAWVKGEWFFWLLGARYSHLQHELFLILCGMSLSGTAALIWALNAARGWVKMSWLNIPITLGIQVVCASILPLHTVAGLTWLIIMTALAQFGHAIATCAAGLLSCEWKK